jgi:hypothetical protein
MKPTFFLDFKVDSFEMALSKQTVFLIFAGAVAISLWYFYHHKKGPHRRREGFSRTCTTAASAGASRMVRSPVDYISDPWKNPHRAAFPEDESFPIEDHHHMDTMPETENSEDCYSDVPYIIDDSRTRRSLYETGDIDTVRRFDSVRSDGVRVPGVFTDYDVVG